MRLVARIFTFVMAAAVVLMPVFSGSADGAEMAAGPDQSLTVVETLVPSYTGGSALSTLYAYSGSLQKGFSVPVPISEPGDGPEAPDLAVDGAGDALAAWSAARLYSARLQSGGSLQMPRGIWYAWRPAGGSFLLPQQLAAPAPGQGIVMAAMSRTGEAAIAYEERGSIYLRRARKQRFGPATLVISGTLTSSGPTTRLGYVGFDAAGELLIVSSHAGKIQARFAAPNRRLGKPQVVGPRLSSSEYLPGRLAVAMNARGAAVIAWASDFVFAAYREPRSRFGPTRRLTPPIPGDSDARPMLANVVMDERGLAIFGLGIVGGVDGLGLAETSYWDGQGAPATPMPLGSGITPEPGMSLAENGANEAAIAYDEELGAGIGMRFNSQGQPFGPPQTITAGPCPETGRPAVTSEHCRGIPTIVGARDDTFFAVTRSSVILQHYTDVYGRVAEIRNLSRAGTTPPRYVSLPEPAFPEPRSAPASIINIGVTATVDTHGRIHAKVQCGTDEGDCSVRMSVNAGAPRRLPLGHLTVRLGGFEERPITITLSHRGRRELARRGSLHVSLLTRTTGTYGPALETTYPFTVLAPKRG
jgi:hypothetical protein